MKGYSIEYPCFYLYYIRSDVMWQKEIWIAKDMVFTVRKDKHGEDKRQVAPKPTSINAATRLFPTTDLRKSDRARNPHDGKCDALLIALYAKRMNL